MTKAGYPPAILRELLAFGAIYKIGKHSVAALGPHKGKRVPCLDTDNEYADDVVSIILDPKYYHNIGLPLSLCNWGSYSIFLGIKILVVK